MKNQARARHSPQSGSILLIVLIGIVLFAAFSYAVTKGMQGGVSSVDDQKTKLAAAEIVEYLNKYKSAFDMLLINGCDQLKIDFSTPYYMRLDGNKIDIAPPGATPECGMYTQEGGGIKPVTFEQYASPAYAPNASNPKAGHGGVRYMDVSLGTSENDLLFNISALDEKICLAALNLVREGSSPFSTLPSDTYTTGGTVSYAKGSPGTLNPIQNPVSSRIFSIYASQYNICQIFVILKVN